MLKSLETLFIGDAFNTRIRVVFINHLDDAIIDEAEFEQYNLPEDFQNVNTISIGGHDYHIVRAEPSHARQYSLTKKLTIRLNSVNFLKFRKTLNDPASGPIQFGKNHPA
jgi:hypothetical protein